MAQALVGYQPVSIAFEVVSDFMHYKDGVYSSTDCKVLTPILTNSLAVHGFLIWFLEWSRGCQPRCLGCRIWRNERKEVLGCQKLMVRYLGTSRIFQNRKRCQHVRPCSMHIICPYSTWLWIVNSVQVSPDIRSLDRPDDVGVGTIQTLNFSKMLGH